MELMTRQLESGGSTELQHQVLSCLAPWMQNLSFAARWEGAYPGSRPLSTDGRVFAHQGMCCHLALLELILDGVTLS